MYRGTVGLVGRTSKIVHMKVSLLQRLNSTMNAVLEPASVHVLNTNASLKGRSLTER